MPSLFAFKVFFHCIEITWISIPSLFTLTLFFHFEQLILFLFYFLFCSWCQFYVRWYDENVATISIKDSIIQLQLYHLLGRYVSLFRFQVSLGIILWFWHQWWPQTLVTMYILRVVAATIVQVNVGGLWKCRTMLDNETIILFVGPCWCTASLSAVRGLLEGGSS